MTSGRRRSSSNSGIREGKILTVWLSGAQWFGFTL
jgi:hypothetical protein